MVTAGATLIAGVISCLATGLGVLPFVLFPRVTGAWKGIASAVAGGMMFGASVFSLVATFKALLPLCLGFVDGAMIYLVAAELLPDSLENCTRHQTAWGVMIGLSAMLLFVAMVSS
jgi:ZIP family zinc transporter